MTNTLPPEIDVETYAAQLRRVTTEDHFLRRLYNSKMAILGNDVGMVLRNLTHVGHLDIPSTERLCAGKTVRYSPLLYLEEGSDTRAIRRVSIPRSTDLFGRVERVIQMADGELHAICRELSTGMVTTVPIDEVALMGAITEVHQKFTGVREFEEV